MEQTLNKTQQDSIVVMTEHGDSLTFHRLRPGVFPDYFYFLRVQVDRSLTADEQRRLAGLVGYAYRATVAGESLGDYYVDTPNSLWFYADTTKTSRDDVGIAFEEFLENLPSLVQNGSPVRKTDRAGVGTKGTRLISGLGDIEISVWVDSVITS